MFSPRSVAIVVLLVIPALLAGCGPDNALPDDPTAISPLLIGEPAPAFTLTDAGGTPYRFDPAALQRPVVLVFYRGGWCPYCSAHLMELREAEQGISDMGFDLLFASADRVEKLAESEQTLDRKYVLLSDNDLVAARAFGVAFRVDDATVERYKGFNIDLEDSSGRDHHGLPVPSVFIVGTDGIIRFEYINPNYKVRISAPLMLAAAQAALDQKPLEPLRR